MIKLIKGCISIHIAIHIAFILKWKLNKGTNMFKMVFADTVYNNKELDVYNNKELESV